MLDGGAERHPRRFRVDLRPSTDRLRPLTSRRLLPLVLAVAGLVAVAALAAHGRPIGHSRGSGPTVSFFDYTFTSIAIVFVVVVAVFVWSLLGTKWTKPGPQRTRMYWAQLLAMFLASTILGLLLLHAHLHLRPRPQQRQHVVHTLTSARDNGKGTLSPLNRRGAQIRWDEVAIVLGLLAALGVAAFAMRKSRPMKEWSLGSHEEVALALDESLDDLRGEPDVRRAIIAAYARMERALAAAGLPRRPSEAPFEYVSRALRSLDVSAPPVTRLTDLFERAKFSHHDPDETMRDEAIDALAAVRDELRAPATVAA